MTNNLLTKIYVLIPVYNEDLYIEEAISSVLDFKYALDVSVYAIVVDDFSTDQTYNVSCNLKEKYGSKLIVKKNNRKGKNSAFNSAMEEVDSGYVCLMGGDDRLVPENLMARAAVIREQSLKREGRSNRLASVCKIQTFSEWPKYDGILLPKKASKGLISGGGIMISFELAREIFPIPESLPNEDSWISLHLRYRQIEILHIGAVGLMYRIHENNSHKRNVGFHEFQDIIWRRGQAVLMFYLTYSRDISTSSERALLTEVVVEGLKSLGASWSLAFLGGISLLEKVKSLAYSSPTAFYIKKLLYKHIAGR